MQVTIDPFRTPTAFFTHRKEGIVVGFTGSTVLERWEGHVGCCFWETGLESMNEISMNSSAQTTLTCFDIIRLRSVRAEDIGGRSADADSEISFQVQPCRCVHHAKAIVCCR
jgi:hypothetical protein